MVPRAKDSENLGFAGMVVLIHQIHGRKNEGVPQVIFQLIAQMANLDISGGHVLKELHCALSLLCSLYIYVIASEILFCPKKNCQSSSLMDTAGILSGFLGKWM